MTDEKYTFISDVREKKRTAAGAFHKRTHCGKGGAVKFPSDYMTKKEINAMNGEVKSYKLNDPMTWAEFKAMPDDIKIRYIKALRSKFNVSDTEIGRMLGCAQITISREVCRLGISEGRRGGRVKWDKDGWCAWCNGQKLEKTEAPAVEEKEKVTLTVDMMPQHTHGRELYEKAGAVERKDPLIPVKGMMTLEGGAADAVAVIVNMLGKANVRLTVSWEVQDAD